MLFLTCSRARLWLSWPITRIDTVSPEVSVRGTSDGAWLNHSAGVVLAATSGSAAGASGVSNVASISYTLDGVAHTEAGAPAIDVLIPESPLASLNGTHTLTFHASDLAGNVSADQHFSVHIDTVGPTTVAKRANGRKGKKILLKYLVRDNLSPLAGAVTLTVRNGHHRVVKTFKPGLKKVSAWYSIKWRPKAKGSYRYTVIARDLAGNKQAKTGSAKIRVK